MRTVILGGEVPHFLIFVIDVFYLMKSSLNSDWISDIFLITPK